MVSSILIAVLAYGHILSAVGWLGGGLLITFIIGPNVRKLAPAASLEFNAKVLPKILTFVQAMIGTTFLFGLLLLYVISDGDYAWLTTSPQGLDVTTGIVVALITSAVVFSVTVPSFKKVIQIANSVIQGGQQAPPPELMKYAKRARQGSLIAISLLFFVLAMMVAAGFT
ncbi:MAG: hypothetical protein HY297_00035 [Thaumarchaeota archaeon]|nr:hypothetical protein [Nitrososphaerota archaeon]